MKIASWTLFGCVGSLLVLGMVMLFSASTGQKEANYLLMQPIWCAAGLLACSVVAACDYRWLKAYPWVPWVLLASVCALLVMALIPGIKVTINGPKRRLSSDRIYSWLHLEETKQDKGLQAYQAMVALGAGGAIGVGLGDGRQKLGRIPEHHTDFILSVIGEELGLTATMFVIVAFLTITVCGVYMAWNACDTFGMLIASGITFLIGLQAVVNIGVVTGSLPNKGLSLPFISYGGGDPVFDFIGGGLFAGDARRAGGTQEAPGPVFWARARAPSCSL